MPRKVGLISASANGSFRRSECSDRPDGVPAWWPMPVVADVRLCGRHDLVATGRAVTDGPTDQVECVEQQVVERVVDRFEGRIRRRDELA